eukprot:7890678-Pyramimonas_sp.AAC.1
MKVVLVSQRDFAKQRTFLDNAIEVGGLARIASPRAAGAGSSPASHLERCSQLLFSCDFARASPSARRDWIKW